ncbi:MAG: Gfo/Idh/MocA family oxidoreductase, partial [Ktedonobacteraceae bacterium]|nr:Gfo/Idh/MocA family oxidoreductase [Ktedonobacteraceae bacterium]
MTIRIIQVGMGGWGRSWQRNVVGKSREVEPVAWVEVVPSILELARNELSLPEERTFTDLAEALAQVECDAVLITANLVGHIPSAITALKAGKHVLMEKPFAATVAEAQTAVELAKQQQRTLMISQNYRHYPATQAARELLRSSELGPVGSVQIQFRRYSTGNPKHFQLWHPLLADMAIHHFDMMRYILGQEASQIYCKAWNPAWSEFEGPASAVAAITFQDGAVVNYSGSWVSTAPQTHWGGEWRFECEKGEAIMRSRDDREPEYLAVRL